MIQSTRFLLPVLFLFCLKVSAQNIKQINGKCGVFSDSNKILIEAKYDTIFSIELDPSLFFVRLNNQYQIVSTTKGAITPKFENKMCNWTLGLDGPISYLEEYEYFPVKIKGKWTFMNFRGKIKKQYAFDEVSQDINHKDELFYARNGKKLMLIRNDSVFPIKIKKLKYFLGFSDSYFLVMSGNKVIFLDEDGQIVEKTEKQDNELWVAEKDCKYGIVNAKGEIIVDFKYDMIEVHNDYIAVDKNMKFAIFDLSGKQISDFRFSGLSSETSDKKTRMIYYDNYKQGLMTTKGKVLTKPIFDYINLVDGLKPVNTPTGYGFINKEGNWVIDPIYSYVNPFSEDLAAVSHNGKYGYINAKGEVVIPFQFLRATSFSKGKARVRFKNGKWGTIDKKGKLIEE